MAQPWDPEHVVSTGLAKSLIEAQFPELGPVSPEPLGAGWDNTAFLVNTSLVFRFPRREIAVPLLDTEASLLPRLVSRLPVAVPFPQWIGRPGDLYPWPFVGYAAIRGRTACRGVDERTRFRVARGLAGFLKALHAVPVDEAIRWGAGPDAWDRFNVDRLRPRISAALEDLERRGVIQQTREWLDIVDDASSGAARTVDSLVHGDLHACHLLIDDEGALSGIIDWGDIHHGNPAVDLSIVWSFLPPDARDEFFDVYGTVNDGTRNLARFRALFLATQLEAYGRDLGDTELMTEACNALRLVAL